MDETYHPLDADVIIVGAGVSGLTAAYALLKKEPSLNILIMEATTRTGGRVASKPLISSSAIKTEFSWFDVGGQWLSSQQTSAMDLLKELEIKVETRHSQGKIAVDHMGKTFHQNKHNPFGFCGFRNKLELASFVQKIENLCKDTSSLDPALSSTTMEDFINANVSTPTNRTILKFIILANCGVTAANITVSFYIFFCNSTHGIANQLVFDQKESWVQLGAQEICDKITILLERDILILMDAQVHKIQVNVQDVQIKSSCGVFYSTHVLVAIPSPAIAKIRFNPPLPAPKSQALRNCVEGTLSKFVATYETAFWKSSGLCGDVHVLNNDDPNCPLVCAFDVSSEKRSALSGYFLSRGDSSKSMILRQLSRYLGEDALQPLKFITKHWTNGSPMCCYKSFDDICALQSSTNRLFWAGAETSFEWFGSIAGAILSGRRAAHEILYDLRPSTLTVDDMITFRSDADNVSIINGKNRIHNTLYKKLINPYYQASSIGVLIMLVIAWRKIARQALVKQ